MSKKQEHLSRKVQVMRDRGMTILEIKAFKDAEKERKESMNKIDWKAKLGSRKFWALLAALIVGILAMFALPENTITQIGGIITALGAVIVYILGESKVDAARETDSPTMIENYYKTVYQTPEQTQAEDDKIAIDSVVHNEHE